MMFVQRFVHWLGWRLHLTLTLRRRYKKGTGFYMVAHPPSYAAGENGCVRLSDRSSYCCAQCPSSGSVKSPIGVCAGGNTSAIPADGYWRPHDSTSTDASDWQVCVNPAACLHCDDLCMAYAKTFADVCKSGEDTRADHCAPECFCDEAQVRLLMIWCWVRRRAREMCCTAQCYGGRACGECAHSVTLPGTSVERSYYKDKELCVHVVCKGCRDYAFAVNV